MTDETPGMMAGDATLPPKLQQQAERERQAQHYKALADALRSKPQTEEPK